MNYNVLTLTIENNVYNSIENYGTLFKKWKKGICVMEDRAMELGVLIAGSESSVEILLVKSLTFS